MPSKPIPKKVILFLEMARISLAAFLVFMLFQTTISFTYVASGSMLPTLDIAETVCSVKMTSTSTISRGDIVIFSPYTAENGYLNTLPEQRDKKYIKRVIGLPGDEINIQNNQLFLNGEPYEEPYLSTNAKMSDFGPITVPENCYFLMGDNRNNSEDSRFIGPIPHENIFSKSIFTMDSISSLILKARS